MPQSRRRSLIGRGRRRLGVELRDAADRIIASDPGLSRLRQGVRAAVAVGTTAVVQWGVAAMVGVTGRAALQHIMIGSMVAMTMATQVRETTRPQLLRTALGTPVAAAVGVGVGSLIAPWHLGSLVVFVLVSFLAVWLRRFGSRWFGYGFLCWQTYFFTLFLKLPAAQLPGVLAAVASAPPGSRCYCWSFTNIRAVGCAAP